MYLFVFKNYSKQVLYVEEKIFFRSWTKSIGQECRTIRKYSDLKLDGLKFVRSTMRLLCTPYYAENCVRTAGIISRQNVQCNNLFIYKINIFHILPRIYLRELNTKWIQFRETGLH